MGNVLSPTDEGTGFPAWAGAAWDRAEVLRYGENPHQRAALYRSAFAGGSGLARRAAAARQADVLQQLRRHRRGPPCGVRLRRAVRRDHQAREPVRHRDRRRHRRGAPARARVRPGVGVRWCHRDEPAGLRGDGRAGQGHLHRGGVCAGLRRRRRRDPQPEAVDPAARVRAAAARRRGRDAAGQWRPADAVGRRCERARR